MSVVHTTAQARGLQRCSTSSCVVCGRQSRLNVIVGGFDEWATTHDGLSMVSTGMREGPFYHFRVCAKHKHFEGVAVLQRGWEDAPQVTRYHVIEAAQPDQLQPEPR
jgi:hypothetical protein